MYTDTITVFNQQKVKKQITWYPTVIRGVELQITAGRNRSTTGLENADSAKVFIKYENSNEKMLVETSPEEIREYLKPKSWNAYTEKNQAFTFQEGIDFFIQGIPHPPTRCKSFGRKKSHTLSLKRVGCFYRFSFSQFPLIL